ncbi:MAG: hypothetical protein LBM03_01365 [Erysipelotrichaceae bacterium]|jgi:ribosomal 50S subunit-recycling heat shock protein|nr:hypothetical protein [Erysipelotrichaceae bacterium]
MRVDSFLKYSLIVKDRETAKSFIKEERVWLNDNPAKPSSNIEDGDFLMLFYTKNILVVKADIKKENEKIIVGAKLIKRYKRKAFSC